MCNYVITEVFWEKTLILFLKPFLVLYGVGLSKLGSAGKGVS